MIVIQFQLQDPLQIRMELFPIALQNAWQFDMEILHAAD